MPPDTVTLRRSRETTGGRFFAAPTPRGSRPSTRTSARGFSTKKEKQEVTAAFAGGALALLLAGAVSRCCGGRLP